MKIKIMLSIILLQTSMTVAIADDTSDEKRTADLMDANHECSGSFQLENCIEKWLCENRGSEYCQTDSSRIVPIQTLPYGGVYRDTLGAAEVL